MEDALIFACSPRAGGNSDAAAEHFCRGVAQAGGGCRVIRLREHPLRPCMGCGACAKRAGCVQPDTPQAEELFNLLRTAPVVFFASPIYFYHLPAGFKAFIDRAQAAYERLKTYDIEGLATRPAYAALIAGRPKGQRLFDGSLLTLRYFLKPFGLRLEDPLLFMGKDFVGELTADGDARAQLEAYGQTAWNTRRR